MIKVLYIAPEFPGTGINAAQVRANALLPRLEAHVELCVIGFPANKNTQDAEVSVSRYIRAERRTMHVADYVLGTISRKPRAFRRFDTDKARKTLSSVLEEFKPDIVHFDSIATLGLLDVVLNTSVRPKIVAHTHDAVSQLYKRRISTVGTLAKLDIWNEYRKILQVEASQLNKVDIIIVDSQEDGDFLASQSSGTKVARLPLGFDQSVFSPEGSKASIEEKSIVFSGAMSGRQSVDAAGFLIQKIMPRVWQKHPDCHVYLVGNKPAPEVQALENEQVHVTGFVTDLASYLRSSTLYVCPLRIGSGMRTRAIEALACGAAVVATPFAMRGIGAESELGCPWITAETASEFSDAIDAALIDDNQELRANAAQYALERFSWDNVAAELVRIYQGCC